MNVRRIARNMIVLAAGLLATAPQLACSTRTIQIGKETTFAGQHIPRGTYTVGWREEGDIGALEITLRRNGKRIASTRGRWEVLARPQVHDSIAYRPDGAGILALVEIRFAGKRQVIRVEGGDAIEQGSVTGN